MKLLYLMMVLNTTGEEKVRTHIHSIPMWQISLISTCHILDTKDEEDVRTICCPWNATRSARMPPGALQRGNQPAENSLVYLHPSIDDAPDNAYLKMQMAMKIEDEEREFGALDVYPDKLNAIFASSWSDFRKPI